MIFKENNLHDHPIMTDTSTLWTLALLRVIGYVFLVFFLFDFVDTLIPLRLTNANWEFQTFGALVEKVPVLFLAYAMIYLGRNFGRKRLEKFLLSLITSLALILGLIYLLMIPIGLVNTNRLLTLNNQQTLQLDIQIAQVKKAQTKLKTTNTQSELQQILSRDLGNNSTLPKLKNPEQVNTLKNRLTTVISDGELKLKEQAQSLQDIRLELVKKSVKWNLGSLLSAVLLFYIWRAAKSK
jgi:hypothetical protein